MTDETKTMSGWNVTVRFSGRIEYPVDADTAADPVAVADGMACEEDRLGALQDIDWETGAPVTENKDKITVPVRFSGVIEYAVRAGTEAGAMAVAEGLASEEDRLGALQDIDWDVKSAYRTGDPKPTRQKRRNRKKRRGKIEPRDPLPVEQRVRGYVLRTAADAFQVESRSGTFTFQFALLGGTCLLRMWSGFGKVDQKITYRLMKNFEKNTGLKLSMDTEYAKILREKSASVGPAPALRLSDGTVDPNRTVAFCDLMGKPASVDCDAPTELTAAYVNPDYGRIDDGSGTSILWEKFRRAGAAQVYRERNGWERYCAAYAGIYGHEPPAQADLRVYGPVTAKFAFGQNPGRAASGAPETDGKDVTADA